MGVRKLAATHGPTVAVLATLGGVAYLGHRTDWKIPKLSELRLGAAAAVEKEDWCEAHNVPDSRCLACHPELGGADPNDWCKEHGVPESKCTVCHPEILTSGVTKDWCTEHGVPESQCTLCHPEIAVKGEAPADTDKPKAARDPEVRPGKDPSTCQTHAVRIQFASAAAVAKAGVRLEAVEKRPIADSVRANGEIEYDQRRVARLSARLPGIVARVEKALGERVRGGEVVAVIDCPEVGRANAEHLAALAHLDLADKTAKRVRASAESGTRSQAELQEAEAALREATIRLANAEGFLVNLGLAAKRGPSEAVATLLPLVAPLDGIVVARDIVPGEAVEPSKVNAPE